MSRTALALAALALTVAPALAGQVTEQRAPGGNITSVVTETERSGWPHQWTMREMQDITAVSLDAIPGGRAIRCAFPATGRIRCGVRTASRRYAVRVTVWEDGSYRVKEVAK